jgi:hypothetical protein
MALAAIGNHRLAGRLTPGSIFFASARLGTMITAGREERSPTGDQATLKFPGVLAEIPATERSYEQDEKLRIISQG